MLKSPQDRRNYSAITLKNGLRAVVVEDPQVTKSAASMVVNVGHFDDPDDRPGMAHFLEHMLFMGTDLCPSPSEYADFIHLQGGRNNAWTGTEHTCFYFDIASDQFQHAVRLFSRFFVAPLFDKQWIASERETIESEYQMKIQDDARRFYQVHKETVNPNHPFSRFSVGNKQTLADRHGQSVLNELRAFYRSRYSAEKMTLVVVGPQSIKQLSQWVTTYFSEVPCVNSAYLDLPPLYTAAQLATQINIVPVKAMKKLVLTFPMENDAQRYLNKPEALIAHMLGYEGTGSIYALLKHEGWVNTLDAGGGIKGSNYKDFNISINLTDLGMEKVDEIITMIFQYIGLLRDQGIQAWRYNEKQAIYQQALDSAEDSEPLDLASHLSMNMQHYPEQHYLIGDYMMQQFEPEQILQLLTKFTPDNMRLTLVGQELETDKQANWYGTPYKIMPISESRLAQWRTQKTTEERLKLPPRNPFVQETLVTRPITHEASQPKLIANKQGISLWYGQNQQFSVPKGHIYIAMDSPVIANSTSQRAASKLFVEMIYDELIETTFQAEMGGIGYELFGHSRGLSLHLGGFTGRQAYLIELLYDSILAPKLKRERFSEIKHQMLRNLHNKEQVAPLTKLFNTLSCLVQPSNIPIEQQIKLITQVSHDKLVAFSDSWHSRLNLEVLMYGNYLRNEALSLSDQLQYLLFNDSQPFDSQGSEIIGIEGLGTCQYEVSTPHADSALAVYYQSTSSSAYFKALYALINHLMSATFFNELRTNQQLGYQVGTGYMPLNSYPGMLFYVQSNVASPVALLEAVDEFIHNFPMIMMGLNDDQWQQAKISLVQQILQKDTSLQATSKRYWVSIGHQDYQFQQRQMIVDAILAMEKTEVLKHIINNLRGNKADRLILHTRGTSHSHLSPLEIGHIIHSPEQFHQLGTRKQPNPSPTIADAL